MIRLDGWVLALSLLGLGIAGCGGGDLSLSSEPTPTSTPGPADTVTVKGTITGRSTFDPVEDIVVIACVGLDPTRTDPADFNDCPAQENESSDADGDFEIVRVENGALRVGFWISRSATPNGMIQDGDSFAELLDPALELVDVDDGETVTLSGVVVNFGTGDAAGDINVGATPTATPGPNATPSS